MNRWNLRSTLVSVGVLAGMALALPACESATEPHADGRQLGLIAGFNQGDPRIAVPDTVWAGVGFSVGVTTYGNSCVRKGDTEVTSSRNLITITPFDYVEPATSVCLDLLQSFNHEVVVEFPVAGRSTIRVAGRAGGALREELVLVSREVVVRAPPSTN